MDFFRYDFMRNALWAVLIITPLFALLGTMIVNNKMAFFSDALGHSALTGIAIGTLLGIGSVHISMAIFAIAFALILNKIKRANISSADTIISVFSSTATAIGLIILARGGNFSKYSSILIGDILSINKAGLLALALILVITLLFWLRCFNQLHCISVNPTLARIKGIPIKRIDNIFVVLIALIVMLSINWVGLLIINALLILPAAAAKNISVNMRQYHLFALIFSMFSGIAGLILSYQLSIASSPTIVVIASVIFFLTYFLQKKVK